DFGTGYSSMSYLRDLQFDVLRIDRLFVRDLARDGGDAILRAIVEMAHALHSEVTAEGIETGSQLDMVRLSGCDAAQGFLLARPGCAADIGRLVAARAAPSRERDAAGAEEDVRAAPVPVGRPVFAGRSQRTL
ncbi:MAG: EAL domain-containing protein, partial [Solirubrobacteraceae bacterium]